MTTVKDNSGNHLFTHEEVHVGSTDTRGLEKTGFQDKGCRQCWFNRESCCTVDYRVQCMAVPRRYKVTDTTKRGPWNIADLLTLTGVWTKLVGEWVGREQWGKYSINLPISTQTEHNTVVCTGTNLLLKVYCTFSVYHVMHSLCQRCLQETVLKELSVGNVGVDNFIMYTLWSGCLDMMP